MSRDRLLLINTTGYSLEFWNQQVESFPIGFKNYQPWFLQILHLPPPFSSFSSETSRTSMLDLRTLFSIALNLSFIFSLSYVSRRTPTYIYILLLINWFFFYFSYCTQCWVLFFTVFFLISWDILSICILYFEADNSDTCTFDSLNLLLLWMAPAYDVLFFFMCFMFYLFIVFTFWTVNYFLKYIYIYFLTLK